MLPGEDIICHGIIVCVCVCSRFSLYLSISFVLRGCGGVHSTNAAAAAAFYKLLSASFCVVALRALLRCVTHGREYARVVVVVVVVRSGA